MLTRFGANLSANFGGELDAYTKMLTDSRNEEVKRMVTDARTLGATGIVGISFNTSSLLEIATELLVVRTAVQDRSIEDRAPIASASKVFTCPPTPTFHWRVFTLAKDSYLSLIRTKPRVAPSCALWTCDKHG